MRQIVCPAIVCVFLIAVAVLVSDAQTVSVTIDMPGDLNFVHIPVSVPGLDTVANVYQALGRPLLLIYYDTDQSQFKSYSEPANTPSDPVNIALEPFMGFLVLPSPDSPRQVTFEGTLPEPQVQLVKGRDGVNLIGLPLDPGTGQAKFAQFSEVQDLDVNILLVVGMDANGKFQSYPPVDLPVRAGESVLLIVSNDTLLDFEATPDTGTPPPTGALPLLMVHGFNGHSHNFDTIRERLVEDGYPSEWLYAIELVPNNAACDPGHVTQIHDMAEKMVQETGSEHIDFLGHSNGGTDGMSYMRYGEGAKRVRNWVSIGGADNFTCESSFGTPPSDPTPGGDTLYTSIYSIDDRVVPNAASIMEGARNIAVSGISHIELLFDETVYRFILGGLQGNGLNSN